jgi:hypothetical protein
VNVSPRRRLVDDAFVDLAAREEERVWVKRQIDGELDDSRLTEGLTGESTVYKRRGLERPELGRPQIKSVLVFLNVCPIVLNATDPSESDLFSISVDLCELIPVDQES